MPATSQQPWILRFGRGYACMLGGVRVCQFMPDRWTSEGAALELARSTMATWPEVEDASVIAVRAAQEDAR